MDCSMVSLFLFVGLAVPLCLGKLVVLTSMLSGHACCLDTRALRLAKSAAQALACFLKKHSKDQHGCKIGPALNAHSTLLFCLIAL